MAMPTQVSASSSAKSGDIHSSSSFMGGDFNVGSGGFDLGSMVQQYWPLLLVVGVGAVWHMKRKKR